MDVYVFLFMYITGTARGVMMASFTLVFDVSLPDYAKNVFIVDQKSSSAIECATTCKVDCYSFTYDPETKECKMYTKEFCTDFNATESTAIKMFVPSKVVDPADCSEVSPACGSGIYTITPARGVSYQVYCDMDTEDGPWTVIQNRQDEQMDFYRNWADYKNGFGDLNGNFWSGLEMIHHLTRIASILRIQLVSWHGDVAYAQYSSFSIEDESAAYRLSVSGFAGNASFDAMAYHNGQRFSTYDNENSIDGNCPAKTLGAWWFNACYSSNLNGPYVRYTGVTVYKSMVWKYFYPGREYIPMMKTRILVKLSDGLP